MKTQIVRLETFPAQIRVRISSSVKIIESRNNALKEVAHNKSLAGITQITKQHRAGTLVATNLQNVPDNVRFALSKIDSVEEFRVTALEPARNGLSALADISRTVHASKLLSPQIGAARSRGRGGSGPTKSITGVPLTGNVL